MYVCVYVCMCVCVCVCMYAVCSIQYVVYSILYIVYYFSNATLSLLSLYSILSTLPVQRAAAVRETGEVCKAQQVDIYLCVYMCIKTTISTLISLLNPYIYASNPNPTYIHTHTYIHTYIHNSGINQLDFTADGKFIQSCCSAYEILFSDAASGMYMYRIYRRPYCEYAV
jgi:hypothetical protein